MNTNIENHCFKTWRINAQYPTLPQLTYILQKPSAEPTDVIFPKSSWGTRQVHREITQVGCLSIIPL